MTNNGGVSKSSDFSENLLLMNSSLCLQCVTQDCVPMVFLMCHILYNSRFHGAFTEDYSQLYCPTSNCFYQFIKSISS